jgi:hypothetical protein
MNADQADTRSLTFEVASTMNSKVPLRTPIDSDDKNMLSTIKYDFGQQYTNKKIGQQSAKTGSTSQNNKPGRRFATKGASSMYNKPGQQSAKSAYSSMNKKTGRKSTKKHQASGNPLPLDFEPKPYSVIIGRGKECKEVVGNRRLKVLASNFLPKYSDAINKSSKSRIVSTLVSMVRDACPTGAFVKLAKNGCWYEVDEAVAREKVGYTFRELLGDQYRSSSKSKVARRHHRRHQISGPLGHADHISCSSDSDFSVPKCDGSQHSNDLDPRKYGNEMGFSLKEEQLLHKFCKTGSNDLKCSFQPTSVYRCEKPVAEIQPRSKECLKSMFSHLIGGQELSKGNHRRDDSWTFYNEVTDILGPFPEQNLNLTDLMTYHLL